MTFADVIGKWQSIDSAPRNGRVIEIRVKDDGGVISGPHIMSWNKDARNPMVGDVAGMWAAYHFGYTWDGSRGYGPTEWRNISDIPASNKGEDV